MRVLLAAILIAFSVGAAVASDDSLVVAPVLEEFDFTPGRLAEVNADPATGTYVRPSAEDTKRLKAFLARYPGDAILIVRGDRVQIWAIGALLALTHHVVKAVATVDERTNHPVLEVSFDHQGARALKDFTASNINRQVPMILGRDILLAPFVHAPVEGGVLLIDPGYPEDPDRLARLLGRLQALAGG